MATIRSGKGGADIGMVELGDSRASSSSFDDGSKNMVSSESLVRYETNDVEFLRVEKPVVANMEEIALKALHVDDDPSLNPWTFRMFFLGTFSFLSLIFTALH